MTKSEQFALDQWLSYYPASLSYADIIEAMTDRENNAQAQYIDVLQIVESVDYETIAEFIENTKSRFERAIT
jgi:hypothetical protein